jgi:hypothetical protein
MIYKLGNIAQSAGIVIIHADNSSITPPLTRMSFVIKRLHKLEPKKPVPPVINIVFMS